MGLTRCWKYLILTLSNYYSTHKDESTNQYLQQAPNAQLFKKPQKPKGQILERHRWPNPQPTRDPRTNSTRIQAKAAATDDLCVLTGMSNHREIQTQGHKQRYGYRGQIPSSAYLDLHGLLWSLPFYHSYYCKGSKPVEDIWGGPTLSLYDWCGPVDLSLFWI